MNKGRPNKRNKGGRKYKSPKNALPAKVEISEEMRLNKYLAHSGIASRRKADELITQGLVTVNGKVVDQAGSKVKPGDVVVYDGKETVPERKFYVLMNKPKGYITTTDDEKGRRTVMDLLKGVGRKAGVPYEPRIYPVGRLDRETTGLLLFTNDGELSQSLTHPSMGVKKVYRVSLDKNFTSKHFKSMVEGVTLEDGAIKPDDLAYPDEEERRELGIEIHSGANRVVRRMFEHFGYEVVHLDRMLYADLTKKDLPRGKWRFLNKTEVIRLKYLNKPKIGEEK